jgi:CheY-like chemotaxis protein
MGEKLWARVNRISGLENLIPELVHTLNNPLASIVGYAQLLLPKIFDPEAKENVEKIIEETQRINQIVKNLVPFIKERRAKKEVVDLNDLIDRALEARTRELSIRNINTIKELSPSLALTRIDPRQIHQVLLNLIDNAEDAISEFHGFGEIKVRTHTIGEQIEIIISDDGPGIPGENISKIFEPFFTTKAKGIGLGLCISYHMVIENGGTMRVQSEWGRGATFIITIPVIKVESGKRKETGEGVERILKGLRGLVIDDDPNILYVVSNYLELKKCEISTAPDVKTALNLIENKDFDFVICDIKMPEKSGSDFYHIVKEKKPSLRDRIIFCTGDLLSDTTKTFIDSVTNPLIEKPFNLSELIEHIFSVVPNGV